ncbi:MAG: DAK2 domain-containing protein [Clostridiaceae bacterium]|nr:DAK2 domain-containing protein [Clostridiaceae bacterium]
MLKRMVISAANHLENNKKKVDALNVFPVPDGDTGTNMSLTLLTASNELKTVDDDSVSAIAEKLAAASLRGARGNSGVILSQLFRGFAKGLRGYDRVNATVFAQALKSAADTAYKAVMKPTEGTILTVAREGAKAAVAASQTEDNITEVFKRSLNHAKVILEKTPDMLHVLKQAGVVDAGGSGLIYILEGALKVLEEDMEVELSIERSYDDIDNSAKGIMAEDIRYTYCTEFLILKKSPSVAGSYFKDIIRTYGDSLLVIDDENVIKVHIHTNNPGIVIQEGIKLGELTSIKIDNMKEQHNNLLLQNEQTIKNKEYGFITVAVGEGIVELFKDLGADRVIEGGQTMNPSTNDILTAVEQVHANHIFVLPSNKNIIPAAEQVKYLTDKHVIVIPSKSIPQSIAAMLAFNPEAKVEENEIKMTEALANVKTGQVTYAVRDSIVEGTQIRQGDILGMEDGHIAVIGKDMVEVCQELIDRLIDEDSSIVTIFYGKDTEEQKARQLSDYIEEKFPDCEVEIHNGGQPLYYYILAVE